MEKEKSTDAGQAQTPLQLAIANLARQCEIDLATAIPEPPYLLEYKEFKFAPRGSLLAIKGKAKQGKSQAATVFISALLGDLSMGVRCLANGLRVLYIDTEQPKYDTQSCAKRMHRMAGFDPTQAHAQLKICNLLEGTNRYASLPALAQYDREKIYRLMIEHWATTYRPDAIVIDGIADLVKNINDLDESKGCITWLQDAAAMYKCLIIGLIHENKGNDDKNMRGHLGTQFLHKANGVFEIVKKDNEFCLSTSEVRGAEEFRLAWTHQGDVLATSDAEVIRAQFIKELLPVYERVNGEPLGHNAVINLLVEIHSYSASTAKRRIKDAQFAGALYKDEGTGKYTLIQK